MLERQALYCLSHCPGPSQNFLHIKEIMRKMGCNLLKMFVLQAKYEKAFLHEVLCIGDPEIKFPRL